MANLQAKITAAMYRQMCERAQKRAAALEVVYDNSVEDENNYIIEYQNGIKFFVFCEAGGRRIAKARHLWLSFYNLSKHYKRLMRAFAPTKNDYARLQVGQIIECEPTRQKPAQ